MPSAKILIVEDDTLLIKMYQTKFVAEGYNMISAVDGEVGWKLIKEQKPDFVIMDVMMPKYSGIQVLEAMRTDPQIKDIPVLMLSNLSQPDKMAKAKQLGVKDFLIKANFTPQQIVDKVKQYLK